MEKNKADENPYRTSERLADRLKANLSPSPIKAMFESLISLCVLLLSFCVFVFSVLVLSVIVANGLDETLWKFGVRLTNFVRVSYVVTSVAFSFIVHVSIIEQISRWPFVAERVKALIGVLNHES